MHMTGVGSVPGVAVGAAVGAAVRQVPGFCGSQLVQGEVQAPHGVN